MKNRPVCLSQNWLLSAILAPMANNSGVTAATIPGRSSHERGRTKLRCAIRGSGRRRGCRFGSSGKTAKSTSDRPAARPRCEFDDAAAWPAAPDDANVADRGTVNDEEDGSFYLSDGLAG